MYYTVLMALYLLCRTPKTVHLFNNSGMYNLFQILQSTIRNNQ